MKKERPHVDSIYQPGVLCRYCDQPVARPEAVLTYSYWQGLPFVCHRICKDAGYRAEALDCQLVDRDCNDCRHFTDRGQEVKYPQWNNEHTECVMVGFGVFPGRCAKFNRPTIAQPMMCTGMECFEHRRLPLDPKL